MVDTSDYMVEYGVHATSFYIASDQTRHTMKLVRDRLHVKYDIEPKEYRIIKAWTNKLREIGSLLDRPRSGRLTEWEMRSMMIFVRYLDNEFRKSMHTLITLSQ